MTTRTEEGQSVYIFWVRKEVTEEERVNYLVDSFIDCDEVAGYPNATLVGEALPVMRKVAGDSFDSESPVAAGAQRIQRAVFGATLRQRHNNDIDGPYVIKTPCKMTRELVEGYIKGFRTSTERLAFLARSKVTL